jgi:excisionase family DNA binding protein
MQRTKKSKPKPAPQAKPQPAAVNGPFGEVLTLAEAAAFLRLPEPEILRQVQEQGLPGRQMGNEWRFSKAAVQRWLSVPAPQKSAQGIWAAAGSWKDDPYLEEMLQDIYRRRGRPMIEE